jgi:hypothetical protein
VKRGLAIFAGLAVLGGAAAIAVQGDAPTNEAAPIAADDLSGSPAMERSVGAKAQGFAGSTPMAERVAVIGVLNKRNGLTRDFRLRPGQGVRVGDLVVKVRACDQTEPYETDQLTGAFVQVIVHERPDRWRRYFSGWLFKESPSLNTVEHPVWDVWTKACMMRHPDVGPDTLAAPFGSSGGGTSKAKKSAGGNETAPAEPAAPVVPESAPSNSTA